MVLILRTLKEELRRHWGWFAYILVLVRVLFRLSPIFPTLSGAAVTWMLFIFVVVVIVRIMAWIRSGWLTTVFNLMSVCHSVLMIFFTVF